MNFKRYNESDNSWVDSHYIKGTDTDAITTLPAIIYPLAQTATIGLKGNTVQNGTPTPDNPVMPQGTGDKTANLFDETSVIENYWLSSANGTAAPQTGYFVSDYIKISAGEIYNLVNIGKTFCWYDENKTHIRTDAQVTQMSAPANAKFLRANGLLRVLNSAMVYTGSTSLPYEPYGYKIPISSGGVTTNVYIGEVQSTRQIKKKVFDGSENWRLSGGNLYSDAIDTDALSNQVCRCTHFTSSDSAGIYVSVGANRLKLFSAAFPEGVTNATTMISWVAQQYNNGTPLTVYYVLASETTGIVNEPIMKIGSYADSISGISIPTTAGANSLDVDTTVKPSEVSASFNGWHPVAAAHEHSGSWT